MSYYECAIDAPYDSAEGDAEQAAHHQHTLDVLYQVGNQYGIADRDIKELCNVACVSFEELKRYSGVRI